MDCRELTPMLMHEAGHVLMALDLGVPIALVRFENGGGEVINYQEPYGNRERWLISFAGREMEFAYYHCARAPSFEDLMLSGDGPSFRAEGRAWKRELVNWTYDRLPLAVHLGLALSTSWRWDVSQLARLVWSDAAFQPYRHLYARPAAPPSRLRAGEVRMLRAGVVGKSSGVNRQAGIIQGYVVAEAGQFRDGAGRPDPRGQFDSRSLSRIVGLMKAAEPPGVKVNFGHEGLFESNLGKFLGRARNPRLDGALVRADLHFDPSAYKTPSGDLANYVMSLAESDPEAISSSLVLHADEEPAGRDAAPIWMPTKLLSSDVVAVGAAVSSLLSPSLRVAPSSGIRATAGAGAG